MNNYTILKTLAQYNWIIGSGNFWHEPGVVRKDNTIIYRSFQVFLFSAYILMTILEIWGVFFGNFPADERGIAVSLGFAHVVVMTKVYTVFRHKALIINLNKRIIEVCEEYEEQNQMKEQYRTLKIISLGYMCGIYGSVLIYFCDGIRKMISGSHFILVVTYYPSYEDNSPLATTVRILAAITLCLLMMTMIISVDVFAMTYIIMFKYKLITLRKYLEGLRKSFDKESDTSLRCASQNLKEGLINAFVMHSKLMSMCTDIETAFGAVVTLQVILCFGNAISLLLQLVLSAEMTFITTVRIFSHLIAVHILLALFLCNAGEITYQSSLLPDAIFYCGWHMCESRSSLLHLVLLALKQAQRPLALKAFKVFHMTYSAFVQVVRTTYSVFALIYAQNSNK